MKFIEREGDVMNDDFLGVMKDVDFIFLLCDVYGGNVCVLYGFLEFF